MSNLNHQDTKTPSFQVKLVRFSKYFLAVIVFAGIYAIASVISQIFLQFQNRDVEGFFLTPYFVSLMSAILSVYAAISAIEHFLPSVKSKTISLIFFGFITLIWLPSITGFLLGLIGVIDVPITSHFLWSNEGLQSLFQTVIAIITSWKITKE